MRTYTYPYTNKQTNKYLHGAQLLYPQMPLTTKSISAVFLAMRAVASSVTNMSFADIILLLLLIQWSQVRSVQCWLAVPA